jgi:hypothetical protein
LKLCVSWICHNQREEKLIVYTLEPYLISLGGGGSIRMILNVAAAISSSGWDIGQTDDVTGLAVATKDAARFHASFYWSDADGKEVQEEESTHLAVIVRSADADAEDRLRQQQLLVNAIKSARDGSLQNLGMFNH